jgi:hypothetical protein
MGKNCDDLSTRIAACDRVLCDTANLSRILHTGILPTDFEAGISDEIRDLFMNAYAAVNRICKTETRDQIPPLASFAKDWGICVPLDPEISSLPLFVAFTVFASQIDYHLSLTFHFSPKELTATFLIRPGASKEVLLAQFDAVLKSYLPPHPSTSKKPKRQQKKLSYYELMFRAYDLRCAGDLPSTIAQKLLPDQFQHNRKRYSYPNVGKNLTTQQVIYLIKAAEKHINATQPEEISPRLIPSL